MDLIRDKAVSFAVDGIGGFRVRSFDQAEEHCGLFVHPVAQTVHAVRRLSREIRLVCSGDIVR